MRDRHADQGESGAILILALVYILTVSAIVAALASWASNDLNNTTNFSQSSSTHYAASSVVDTAIQSIRYTPVPSTAPTVPAALTDCWAPHGSGAVSGLTINYTTNGAADPITVAVWCSTQESLSNSITAYPNATRVVTFTACQVSATTLSDNTTQALAAGTTCATAPLLTAIVSYDDYPSGESVQLPNQCTPPSCGDGVEILDSWNWG
jgi:hypothetical protein